MALGLAFGIVLFIGGAAFVYMAVASPQGVDAEEYLRDLEAEGEALGEFQQKLAQPFVVRALRPLGGVLSQVGRLTPSNYLDEVHRKLLHAGLSASLRAEELVTAQVLTTALGLVLAILWVTLGHPAARFTVLALVLLPFMGAIAPHAWLNRKVAERKEAILKDLPDTLDLLAISVEAGMGFEGALDVVCTHFSSPLADEFSRTLREMELGLSRRDALQNLKRRTEVPDLSNFVLAMTQADALGMPIGRVLKTQAAEMRLKRRQWARERAGKLPVKILFPLVMLIFPAILVVILGPAVASISGGI